MLEIFLPPLIAHAQRCPNDFFRTPQFEEEQWQRLLIALLYDFLRSRAETMTPLEIKTELLNHRDCIDWLPPLCWIFSAPSLHPVQLSQPLFHFMLKQACLLKTLFPPQALLFQKERAEECLRLLLNNLQLKIAHESASDSLRIWQTLSTAGQQELFRLRQQKRQREIAILQAQKRLEAMENSD
jgi:hypothetical protein